MNMHGLVYVKLYIIMTAAIALFRCTCSLMYLHVVCADVITCATVAILHNCTTQWTVVHYDQITSPYNNH